MRLRMTPVQARQVWGTPSRVHTLQEGVEAWQYDQYLGILVVRGGEVYQIETNSPAFSTKEGIKVGARLSEVLKVFGRPECRTSLGDGLLHGYTKLGLLVKTVEEVVRGLAVTTPPFRCQ